MTGLEFRRYRPRPIIGRPLMVAVRGLWWLTYRADQLSLWLHDLSRVETGTDDGQTSLARIKYVPTGPPYPLSHDPTTMNE